MKNTSIRSMNANMKTITKYYRKLAIYARQNKSVGSINEWIVDNYYLLSEQELVIKHELNSLKILKIKPKRRLFLDALIEKYLHQENYKLDPRHLFEYLNRYQMENDDYFSYDEIDYINNTIKCNIIARLSELTKQLRKKFYEKETIDHCFKKLIGLIEKNKAVDLDKCMPLNSGLLNSYFKVVEINHRINSLGEYAEEAFLKLNEFLEANNTSLKLIIDLEHEERTKESMLMVNLISAFKKAIRFKLEDLYVQISYVEKALINEKTGVYDTLYEVSKLEYRKRIKYLVKKSKKTEYEFIQEVLKQAGKEHVGFHLFKPKNYQLRAVIYVSGIVILTFALSYFVSLYLGLLAFFLFLIPSCGFVVDVVNQILMKATDVRTLFRIKLESYLPPKYSTMIVIPTILNNQKKVNDMFNNLELYYLSNRAKNLYFCLLGDVTSEKTARVKMDEKIVKTALERVRKLNNKYGEKKFYFAYRNRFYNSSEEAYLGYERKRGALQHFNKLLLGKLSEKEKEKYFQVHTFQKFKTKIKYVITLDADTKLLLNTALKLIGTMAHPMNQPVLSEDGSRVVAGHAIMQPRVSIDVEVTNKSEYSQLFAGLGGLDIYSAKQFDLYQDIFGEGSFTGKGIYDLELFEKILGETFPENLILSHDLIEGNYLRCGFISDVELFDGFPSKYFNDAMRHHRWTRGDWQIISWLKSKVRNLYNKKTKNPINLISKWKIFDNLRRSLRSPFLFLIVVYAFTFSLNPPLTLLLVVIIIAVPIFFYLLHNILSRQKYDMLLRYYLRIIWGILAVIAKSLIVFALLPYETFLYCDAVFKSLYRMYVSKKNLLNWITSEEVEAIAKNNLYSYLGNFKINYVAGILLLVSAWYLSFNYFHLAVFVTFIWFLAPLLMYKISRDIKDYQKKPGKRMESDIREVAQKTWLLFQNYLTREYNYLIPDNYQLNRNQKLDLRTSSTNIGFSLIAIISAYELKIISKEIAIDKINNVIRSVEDLKKWNGHLYNWYAIDTKKPLPPYFISTADSGNFIATLYVVKGFLEQFVYYKPLKYRVQKLIDNADFSKLYNEDGEVFSIGYVVNEGTLVPYNYNNFLSEARLTSFIAIAKGDVPFKHWFRLDKTLTKYKWYKGVVSWSGTMFEYYMPLLFMKTFEHTLLDETYAFAYYAHREFMREVDSKLPWGISESAYNQLDDAQNYKYKAFGIPYLKFHDSEIPKIVLAPYGSLMALNKYPEDVYNNIKKFQKLNMLGKYGFYDAYDHEDKAVVKAYYTHHQGMVLASITNYLQNNVLQEYFHADKNIKSVEILLKEKVQIRAYIDLKIARYKKYNYKREIYESDLREQNGIMPIPEIGVLSNGSYSLVINDRGLGFSKYKNLQVNRYQRMSDEPYGVFFYIKDKTNNKIWTNAYRPFFQEPNYYHVVFASDRIKFVREDDTIITTTEIMVTKDHHAEIRKISLENTGRETIDLELTSYGEVVMARPEEDTAHRAFNSITINCEVEKNTSSLIFTRYSRTKDRTKYFIVNRFFAEDDEGDFEYETSRLNFLGRNNSTNNPVKIKRNEKLTSNHHALLDPIMSIRKKISLKSNSKQTFYLLVGFGKSKQQVMDIVDNYDTERKIEDAFEKATVFNNMRNNYAGLTGIEIRAYNRLLKYIYQPVAEKNRRELLQKNELTQENLWQFGVSGDLPIILVDVYNVENSGFIQDILKSYEFYQKRAMYIDVLIINNEVPEKKEMVQKSIDRMMYRINSLNSFDNLPGNVYVINDVSNEERNLLKAVACLHFDGSLRKSLNEQIDSIVQTREMIESMKKKSNMLVLGEKGKVCDFGRFSSDGNEYVIKTVDTPMPWSNVIANQNFGTIITNNYGGFTYARNSREFKLTSWSNDPVLDPNSETIYVNGERLIPSEVRHGFGYSTFITKTAKYDIRVNVFVPLDDNIKIYDMHIKTKTKRRLALEFSIMPVLGVNEDETARFIYSSFDEKSNSLILCNSYNKVFRYENVFISSSEKITDSDVEELNKRVIKTKVTCDKEKRISFLLGSGNSKELTDKYRNFANIDESFAETKKNWLAKLNKIKIKTPDDNFNKWFNGWLLYQTYASRLYARAAFYQVGGAIGFRDQLQDVLCLLQTNSQYAKEQILKQAKHQFVEGDVLHWWHEEMRFGSRTRFSDDYLWLVYVTYEYLVTTGDYSILDERVGFVEGESLNDGESEKGINYTYSVHEESLYFHLKLCIEKAIRQFGANNLPLMGSGDWNDGMNKVGHLGKGESVWVGFFLYDILLKMMKISQDEEFVKLCSSKAADLKQALNKNAWDGKWYLRAFYDNESPLGSHRNVECQIDLISQAWSVLTGVADSKRQKQVLEEVKKNLVDDKTGIIKLLTPPFTNREGNPGYISYYIPGVRENGAQYTHAAMWYIMALVRVGKHKEACQYFMMLNPSNKAVETYKTEPYVLAADVYSNKYHLGQGGWTWYTGSASWAYKIALEEIIGVKKQGDKLVIKPGFDPAWKKVEVEYWYGATKYQLVINYTKEEKQVTLVDDGKKHQIEIG